MKTITFLGGAGTVTGSKFLLNLDGYKILVDCGLFQGLKYLRELNRKDFPVNADDIDVVLITHAHLDHVGYIPLLVKQGFKGSFLMTDFTSELTKIVLLDSAKIQEEDAERANKEGFSKHAPALPLYTELDVHECLSKFQSVPVLEWRTLTDSIRFRFQPNGHIPGSCFIEIEHQQRRYVFSGDIGRKKSSMLSVPNIPEQADVLIMESTYGNRLHPEQTAEDQLQELLSEALQHKGSVLIPSFAIGRAQELLLLITRLKKKNKIPPVPIYLDSPMSYEVTELLFEHPQWHTLTLEECKEIAEDVNFITSFQQTLEVLNLRGPKIVVAASGMLTGGRALTYLKEYIGNTKNTILLSGFQAEGTRGKTLQNRVHEIKLFGHYYPVKANVREITTLSAHADQHELLEWMSAIKTKPGKLFLVHGENDALYSFLVKIRDEFKWEAYVPSLYEEIVLD